MSDKGILEKHHSVIVTFLEDEDIQDKLSEFIAAGSRPDDLLCEILQSNYQLQPSDIAHMLGKVKRAQIAKIKSGLNEALRKFSMEYDINPKIQLYFQRKDGSLSEERRMSLLDVLSFEGTLALGMNKEQVMRIKGRPLGKRKNKGPWGLNERWWYKKEYLYFENDKLVSWLKK